MKKQLVRNEKVTNSDNDSCVTMIVIEPRFTWKPEPIWITHKVIRVLRVCDREGVCSVPWVSL